MASSEETISQHCDFKSRVSNSETIYKYNFKWSIENISKLARNETIKSPEFSPAPGIKMYGEIQICEYWIFKFIPCDSFAENFSKLNARFQTTLWDKNDKRLWGDSKDLTFTLEDLQHNNIFNVWESQKKRILPLKDDTLVISVEIEFYECAIETFGKILSQTRSDTNMIASTSNILKKLSIDFLNIYLNSIDSDVILRVGNQELRANKAILKSRSKIFNKMFESNLIENAQNAIDIQDLSSDIMNELLCFVYSGEEKNYNYDTAYQLFYAADKYDISDLRQICCKNIIRQLSHENVFDVLSMAERHQDAYLLEESLIYCMSNFEKIASSQSWINFAKEEPILAGKIVIKCSQKLKN